MEVISHRVQAIPAEQNIFKSFSGPFVMISDNATLKDSVLKNDGWVRLLKEEVLSSMVVARSISASCRKYAARCNRREMQCAKHNCTEAYKFQE